MSQPKIDFVITWVDGTDPKWLAKKIQTLQKLQNTRVDVKIASKQFTSDPFRNSKNTIHPLESPKIDASDLRFRNDFDFLKYWFRGVEKFAPWFNQIFFVTFGHLPSWLKPTHPKLRIIRHEDFIPKEFLPTFNSHTIENHLHLIPGLSEYFVYFNDDFYLLKPTKPTDFFAKSRSKKLNKKQDNSKNKPEFYLPRAFFAENILINNPSRDIFPYIQMNNMAQINQKYHKSEFYHRHFSKAYHLKYGIFNLRNLLLSPWKEFSLIYDPHCATSYLKSTFKKVWQDSKEELTNTSAHPFRSGQDISHMIFFYTQLLEGQFIPRSPRFSHHTMLSEDDVENQKIIKLVEHQKYHLLCINDGNVKNLDKNKSELEQAFNKILPEKSSFEQ